MARLGHACDWDWWERLALFERNEELQLTLEVHGLELTTKTKQRALAKAALRANGVDVAESTAALREGFMRGDP